MTTLIRLLAVLAQVLEPLRFFKHSQDRRAAEAAAAREHMLELIDAVSARSEAMAKANAAALAEVGRGIAAQSEAMKTWFELFKQDQGTDSPTVRPEDEWQDEEQRELSRLIEAGFPVNGTPEEQQAWFLNSL